MSTKVVARPKFNIYVTNCIIFFYGHMAAVYGLYLCFTEAMWSTIFFQMLLYIAAEIGVTAGSHRLWSHKAFKCKLPLEVLIVLFNTLAHQNSAIHWARDHRLHHKYTDTDADPYNSRRGFFFSHVGWLLVKKHPEVREKGKLIDCLDLYSNSLLRFQKKYAVPLFGMVCYVLPTVTPMYFWRETLRISWHLNILRYVLNLNATWLINSAAHMWGYKPYDKSVYPTQNMLVSVVALGEGFHNYHHVFPCDYRAAELGNNKLNLTTLFIDFFAKIGWAYDLKTVSPDIVRMRQMRTGDGKDLWGEELTE